MGERTKQKYIQSVMFLFNRNKLVLRLLCEVYTLPNYQVQRTAIEHISVSTK